MPDVTLLIEVRTMAPGRPLLDVLRHALMAATAGCICVACPARVVFATQASSAKLVIPPLDTAAHLPAKAVLVQQMQVSFDKANGADSVVLAYTVQGEADPHRYDAGIRVMQYRPASGWAVGYEENNGGGYALTMKKVGSANGAEGVVVILEESGAGTTTDWHIIALVNGRFSVLDPTPLRDRALKKRGYSFMGYNGVSVNGDLVTEELPGYSKGRARCCPDKPSIDVRTKFTGTSIKLASVEEVPFTPERH
jgi:hypothetical protein